MRQWSTVTTTMTQLTAAGLTTVCHHTNQTDQRSQGCRYRTITLTHFNSSEPTVALVTEKERRGREEQNMLSFKEQWRVRGEHTIHELFLFVGYLYLCNNSAVKCVPCTVPHFIVHKDTKMISPKTTNMSCWYRYITHFNLFHRLVFL